MGNIITVFLLIQHRVYFINRITYHYYNINTNTKILIQNLILINTHIGIKEYEDYSLLYVFIFLLKY